MNIWIAVLTAITLAYGVYYIAIGILGSLRKRRVVPSARPRKKLAVLIAARNEESVIGECVASLKAQRYPDRLYDIYVFPNNCTDDTAGAAQRAGARVICPDVPIRSKGDVLFFAFERLLDAPEHYDGYLIFDADNIVDEQFLKRANDALLSGVHAAQGYRDSKNPHANWIAGSTSIFFWAMDGMYNRPRYKLGMSAAFNGTGIVLSAEAARAVHRQTYSLTEDLELTALCAMAGYRLAWINDAITYDEQPTTFVDSFRQRRRWFGGSFQCLLRYAGQLFSLAFKRRDTFCLDMLMLFAGTAMQLLGVIPGVLTAIALLFQLLGGQIGLLSVVEGLLGAAAASYVALALFALAVCALERKIRPGIEKGILMFPIFMFTWLFANLSVFFAGVPSKWKQIRHGAKRAKTEATQ
ncbi:MAG TPA: glycosyltransferase family 2 protein [Candidatus Alectryocaccomicrobium excrementavium]|uniref:Glycosyltransferase family 2 protein n=1 Tax=Candidatus Alectryocaccomicrobium excrementavium TaxID=2840668 RepID=A0A9D1FY18_9FIRM|nr:glycosyltransferase family 2 protein [Candidatus Alectryocaccomicrobium excrementavium]